MPTEITKPTLLVTVGSTLFPHLTDAILTRPFLELLSDSVGHLTVQLGKARLPANLAERIGTGGGASDAGSVKGKYKEMDVDVFRYTDDFEGLVRGADLVISHAGQSGFIHDDYMDTGWGS